MPFKLNSKITQTLLIVIALTLSSCGESPIDLDQIKDQIENDKNDGENNQESIDPEPESPPKTELPEAPNPFKNEQASNSSSFLRLPNGKKLSDLRVKSSSLRLAKGVGNSFTSSKESAYKKLKRETLTDSNHKVQWAFMNLDTGKMIERSLGADRKIFGASSSKIYVAATLLDRKGGDISSSQTQKMADMLVVSSNTAWTSLQKEIGDGSSDKGRERIHNFTQKMGYEKTRGYQGYWGSTHGNELTPDESVQTLYDIYQNNFKGAETLWKIIHACRTGTTKGRKYLPSNIYVGGKTGSYSGSTENPQTGKTYSVRMKNHLLVFAVDGVQYGLAVLANSGTDESSALIAGGLIREYTSVR